MYIIMTTIKNIKNRSSSRVEMKSIQVKSILFTALIIVESENKLKSKSIRNNTILIPLIFLW